MADFGSAVYTAATTEQSFSDAVQAQNQGRFDKSVAYAKDHGTSDNEANYYATVTSISSGGYNASTNLGVSESPKQLADELFGEGISEDRRQALYTAGMSGEGAKSEYIFQNLDRQNDDDWFEAFRSNSTVKPHH